MCTPQPLVPHLSPPPWIARFDGDAFTYIGKPDGIKPGTAPSAGVFVRDGKRYYGKGNVTDDRQYALREALQEMLGNCMYRHFGCHAQQLILSEQQWLPGSEMFSNDISASSGVHLMSEWIDGFTPFGPFVAQQLLCAVWPPPSDVFVMGERGALPVRGLGQIIAVSMLLNDTDCIGGTGGNVGYTIVTDLDTNAPLYAQAIKIDPGQSFRLSRKDDSQSKSRYNTLLASSLDSLRRGRAHVNPHHTFGVSSLPLVTVSEFEVCVSPLISSHMVDGFRALLCSPGLEPLFPTHSDLAHLLGFLEARRAALTSYAHPDTTLHPSTALSLPSPSECLDAITSEYRRTVLLVDPVTGVKHPMDDRFVNLSLLGKKQRSDDRDVDDESDETLPQRNEGGRIVLVNSFEAIRAKKTDIAVEDMFSRCTGSTKRVNISGGAGIGKSTCCQSIVSRWAAGRLFTEFTLVVWVPLRRLTSGRYPNGDRYTVFDVIIQECLDLHPSPQLREAVEAVYHPDQTLWILDGYDEIVGRMPDQLTCAFDEMVSAPNRILTGRPHAMNSLSGVLRGDVDIEVAGFKDDNIVEFVQKFGARAPNSGAVLLKHLHQSALVWDLAHVPVNLVLLCHVFADSGIGLEEFTLTQLYTRVESLMARRYCAKLRKDITALTPERQAEIVAPVFSWLSEVAYQSMKIGAVMISGASIVDWLSGLVPYHDICDAVLPAFKTSGLLVQANGDADADDLLSVNFHLLHLTLQEYFAAKRVSLGLAEFVPFHAAELHWLRTHKYSFHLEVMWWFVGGLVGSAAHAGSSSGLIALSELWTAKPRDVGHVFEARAWLRMIEEGRLWRLSECPAIISHTLAFARPPRFLIDDYGKPCLLPMASITWSEEAKLNTLRSALEQCPLLCREAILADDHLASLARYDFQGALRLYGAALLNCGWLWDVLRQRLLGPGRGSTSSWSSRLPDSFLDRPELFAILRECTCKAVKDSTSPVPHPELTLSQLLTVDSAAVVQWMRAVFALKTRHYENHVYSVLKEGDDAVRSLSLTLLDRAGPEKLLQFSDVTTFVRYALVNGTENQRAGALRVLRPLGPKLLELDWVVAWCRASPCTKSQLKDTLCLFSSVGERGLSCDWLLACVREGLLSDGWNRAWGAVDPALEESLDVISSIAPFMRKWSCEHVLLEWIAAIVTMTHVTDDSHLLDDSKSVKLLSALRLMTTPLGGIPAVVDRMRRYCARVEPESVANYLHLEVVLMAACGPDLLRAVWYTDWLSRAACDEKQLEPALYTLRDRGSAVLSCEPAMAVLQAGLSSTNERNVFLTCDTITGPNPLFRAPGDGLCDDPLFRQDPRALAWLRVMVGYEHRPDIRSVYLRTGTPVIVDAAEEATVCRLLTDDTIRGLTTWREFVAASFARLTPACGALQPFALGNFILQPASMHACISFDGSTLIVDSNAGRFEHNLKREQHEPL